MSILHISLYLGLLFQGLLAAAAFTASIVAILTYRNWKEQQKWQGDRELAKNLLVIIYQLREFLEQARDPMYRDLFSMQLAANSEPDEAAQRVENRESEYFKKLSNEFNEIKNTLKSTLLEAEALWGPKINELALKLDAHAHEQIRTHLRFVTRHNRQNRMSGAKFFDELYEAEDAIFRENDTHDEYDRVTKTIVSDIEKYLSSHLGRRKP